MSNVNTIKRDGSRFYVHPDSGDKAPGVTSIVDMVPKPFLQFWAAKVVAEQAVENAPAWIGLALNGQKEAAVDVLKGAPRRVTRGAADTGTEAHDLFERLALDLPVGRVHPEIQAYVDHFRDFLDKVQPEFLLVEEAVWSDTHRYAGSFDAFAKIEGETIALDWKTTRSGVHAEVALQLSAYRHADYVLRKDKTRIPLPKTTGGAVMHVRPEGWNLHPIKSDREVFEHFVHLRSTFEWVKDLSKGVVGDPIAGSTAEEHVSASKRRASR